MSPNPPTRSLAREGTDSRHGIKVANGDGDGQPDAAVEQFTLGEVEDIPAVGAALDLGAGIDSDPAEPNVAVFAWSQLQPSLPPMLRPATRCAARLLDCSQWYWRRRARDEPPSPEMSVKSRGFKHYGRRDILAAFGIANNEGHGHQLPSMQIVDRDVASQVPVIEALPRIALNQNHGCFGIVHARTSRTLRSAPANEKTYGLAQPRHN